MTFFNPLFFKLQKGSALLQETDKNAISTNSKNHLFQPGVSGNPSGRPKQTKEEKEALEEIRKLAPKAVAVLKKTLTNKNAPLAMKLKVIEIILDRTYGKAPASINVTSDANRIEASRSFILSLVQGYQAEEALPLLVSAMEKDHSATNLPPVPPEEAKNPESNPKECLQEPTAPTELSAAATLPSPEAKRTTQPDGTETPAVSGFHPEKEEAPNESSR